MTGREQRQTPSGRLHKQAWASPFAGRTLTTLLLYLLVCIRVKVGYNAEHVFD